MIDKRELDDIFGIPQDNSHLDDDSGSTDDVAFGDIVSQNNLSKKFSDQIDVLSSNIKNTYPKNVSNDQEDLVRKNVNSIDGGIVNVIQKQQDVKPSQKDDKNIASIEGDNDDEIFSQPKERLGREVRDGFKPDFSQVVCSGQSAQQQKAIENSPSTWKMEDENLSFINFYKLKQNAINGWLLPGGEINFDLVHEELVNAKVNLSNIGFSDYKSMFESLKQIQHWKDRVTEISLKTNAQYYTWKRAIDLFRGTLARMYYEKPSEKQEGVVMEHMGDMVKYYSQLEALHASVDAVSRNLDNAFDCVSRQITLCLPVVGKDIDAIDKKVSKVTSDFSAEILSGADVIPGSSYGKSRQNQDSKMVGKKIGTVDWKDI